MQHRVRRRRRRGSHGRRGSRRHRGAARTSPSTRSSGTASEGSAAPGALVDDALDHRPRSRGRRKASLFDALRRPAGWGYACLWTGSGTVLPCRGGSSRRAPARFRRAAPRREVGCGTAADHHARRRSRASTRDPTVRSTGPSTRWCAASWMPSWCRVVPCTSSGSAFSVNSSTRPPELCLRCPKPGCATTRRRGPVTVVPRRRSDAATGSFGRDVRRVAEELGVTHRVHRAPEPVDEPMQPRPAAPRRCRRSGASAGICPGAGLHLRRRAVGVHVTEATSTVQ